MGYLHCLLILLLARVFLIAESSFADYKEALFDIDSVIPSHGIATCNGRVGDCIDEAEEMMLDSEASRRVLAQTRYISYDALRRGPQIRKQLQAALKAGAAKYDFNLVHKNPAGRFQCHIHQEL
ncbi:rapid alkalinization factor-like [Coffea eugenioides]|uniref:rapid alkalinization factor-like n=1 Tax=Coffea eugenioides TaxID=49369 RepID=UPI000F604BFF|nr:rapid alkalinization factor-like [Coffea eugenioides]